MSLDLRTAPRQDAFSLLELLVVLAVVATVVTLVVPSIRTGQVLTLESATHEIAAALRRARALSISTNAPVELIVDVKRRQCSIAGATEVSIPAEFEMTVYTSRALLLAENLAAIRFFPDGSSDGGRITLASEDAVFHIDVNWFTGEVQLLPTRGAET